MKALVDVEGHIRGTDILDVRGEDPQFIKDAPPLDSRGRTPWRVIQAVEKEDVLDPDSGAVIGRRIKKRGLKLRSGPAVMIGDPDREAFMEPEDWSGEDISEWAHRDELLWDGSKGRFTKPYERLA
ncbi:MAG: hypothetical protein ACE5LX_01420 [Nitrospinota bacterium]